MQRDAAGREDSAAKQFLAAPVSDDNWLEWHFVLHDLPAESPSLQAPQPTSF